MTSAYQNGGRNSGWLCEIMVSACVCVRMHMPVYTCVCVCVSVCVFTET